MNDFSDVYSTGHNTGGTARSAGHAGTTGAGRATSANRAARQREAAARSQHETAEGVTTAVDLAVYRRAGAL